MSGAWRPHTGLDQRPEWGVAYYYWAPERGVAHAVRILCMAHMSYAFRRVWGVGLRPKLLRSDLFPARAVREFDRCIRTCVEACGWVVNTQMGDAAARGTHLPLHDGCRSGGLPVQQQGLHACLPFPDLPREHSHAGSVLGHGGLTPAELRTHTVQLLLHRHTLHHTRSCVTMLTQK